MGKGAVVLELNSSNVTLLTDDGAFVRMAARRLPGARYVGQHVDLDEAKSAFQYGGWLSVAAACLIFLLVLPVFFPTPVQAWVTLDGTSSLEVLVDRKMRVLEIRPLNEGAANFVDQFGIAKDVSFQELVDQYMSWSSSNGDSRILVTSTGAVKQVKNIFNKHHSDFNFIIMEVNPLARDEADKFGVSIGRALVLAMADSQGMYISVDEMKEANPVTLLLEVGADIEQFISTSSDPSTQADKIKKLPESSAKKPNDVADNGEPKNRDEDDIDSVPPGQDKKDQIPPGQEKKDTPGQDSKDHTPPGQDKKDEVSGVDKGETAPGVDKKDQTSSEPDENDKTPPSQAKRDDIPPDHDKEDQIPPGQAKKDEPPPGLRNRLLPNLRPNSPGPPWRVTPGPPFKNGGK